MYKHEDLHASGEGFNHILATFDHLLGLGEVHQRMDPMRRAASIPEVGLGLFYHDMKGSQEPRVDLSMGSGHQGTSLLDL